MHESSKKIKILWIQSQCYETICRRFLIFLVGIARRRAIIRCEKRLSFFSSEDSMWSAFFRGFMKMAVTAIANLSVMLKINSARYLDSSDSLASPRLLSNLTSDPIPKSLH